MKAGRPHSQSEAKLFPPDQKVLAGPPIRLSASTDSQYPKKPCLRSEPSLLGRKRGVSILLRKAHSERPSSYKVVHFADMDHEHDHIEDDRPSPHAIVSSPRIVIDGAIDVEEL